MERDLLTEEEIRELSKRAFLPNGTTYATQVRATLQRAARLGAERERERAARVCEAEQQRRLKRAQKLVDGDDPDAQAHKAVTAGKLAAAIRRGEGE